MGRRKYKRRAVGWYTDSKGRRRPITPSKGWRGVRKRELRIPKRKTGEDLNSSGANSIRRGKTKVERKSLKKIASQLEEDHAEMHKVHYGSGSSSRWVEENKISVNAWEKYGKQRLYVNKVSGPRKGSREKVGYIDLSKEGTVGYYYSRPGNHSLIKAMAEEVKQIKEKETEKEWELVD